MTPPPGGLHDDVVDDTPGDEEVGGEDEGEDGPGGGHLDGGCQGGQKRWDGKDVKGAFVKMGQQSTDNLPPKRT